MQEISKDISDHTKIINKHLIFCFQLMFHNEVKINLFSRRTGIMTKAEFCITLRHSTTIVITLIRFYVYEDMGDIQKQKSNEKLY